MGRGKRLKVAVECSLRTHRREPRAPSDERVPHALKFRISRPGASHHQLYDIRHQTGAIGTRQQAGYTPSPPTIQYKHGQHDASHAYAVSEDLGEFKQLAEVSRHAATTAQGEHGKIDGKRRRE
jgi:hypothetical protein